MQPTVNRFNKFGILSILAVLLVLGGCSKPAGDSSKAELTPYKKPDGYHTLCSGRYRFDIPEPYDLEQLSFRYFLRDRKIEIAAKEDDTFDNSIEFVKNNPDLEFEHRIDEIERHIESYYGLIEWAKEATDDGAKDRVVSYRDDIKNFQAQIDTIKSHWARYKVLPFEHPKSFVYFDGYYQVQAQLLHDGYRYFLYFDRLNDDESDEQLMERAMDFLNNQLVLVKDDNYPEARGLCMPGAYVLNDDDYLEQKLEFALQSAPEVLHTVLISDGYRQNLSLRTDQLGLFIANNHHQDEFTRVAIGTRPTQWIGVIHLPDDEELTNYLVAQGKIEPPKDKDTTNEDIAASLLGMGAYADLVVSEKKKLIKELNVDVTQIPGLRFEGGGEVYINDDNKRLEPHVVFFMKSPSKRYHPENRERQVAPPFAQSKPILVNMMRSFRIRDNGHALPSSRSENAAQKP